MESLHRIWTYLYGCFDDDIIGEETDRMHAQWPESPEVITENLLKLTQLPENP